MPRTARSTQRDGAWLSPSQHRAWVAYMRVQLRSEIELADRVQFVRDRGRDRIAEIELQFTFATVRLDAQGTSSADVDAGPLTLAGPVPTAIDQILALRSQYGVSGFAFNALDGIAWAELEKVVAAVK